MSNLSELFGGGGGSSLGVIVFNESTTWSPAINMVADIYVIGAGGGGSVGCTYNSVGGGAGGCAISNDVSLSSSTTYTISIGAGGAGAYTNTGGVAGTSGGNTTFSGSGITTMTGNGGGGGAAATASDETPTPGAGGTASGGTLLNTTGGSGGDISGRTEANYNSSGGGSVGVWSTGRNGQPILDLTQQFDTPFSIGNPFPFNYSSNAKNFETISDNYNNNGLYYEPIFSDLGVSAGRYYFGGRYYGGRTNNYYVGPSGPLAGGLGISWSDGWTSQTTRGGNGGYGAGGGGCTGTYNANSGSGGDGIVFIHVKSVG